MLAPAFLDELRARTTLSALVGRTTKLVRAGREHKACCPFHQEKTPSFWVNDEKGFYHCFGCGAHGDAIRWLTDQQGLPFMDAVKELAAAAGMDLPAPDPETARRQERAAGLHDVTAAAQDWFAGQLGGIDGAAARAYLQRRGISAETARAFGLGHAPDNRTRLKTALAALGEDRLAEAGLLVEVEGKDRYDRFRGRLTIPIRDPRGRVIAFGGRILGEGEPKYLNSPETPLFDKGRTLYNLDRAAPASRAAKRVLVVEGYLDVIGLAQAGIAEAVAPLGTALTEGQMQLLWRLVDAPLLCFDGDAAGQKAAIRAARRALPVLPLGKSLRFAHLPAGKDPDDLVRDGGAPAFEAAVAAPTSLVETLYRAERETVDPASPDDRAGLRGRLEALAGAAPDKLVAEEYRRSFTGLFFDEFGWKRPERSQLKDAILSTSGGRIPDPQRAMIRPLLYGCTRFPAAAAMRLEELGKLPISDPILHRWRGILLDAGQRTPPPTEDGVRAILDAEKLTDAACFDMQQDLMFSFTRRIVDPAHAIGHLIGTIELLNEERDLDDELARLNARAIADTGLDRYEAIEAARQRIREQKLRLRTRGYELGATVDGAGQDDDPVLRAART